MCIFPVLQGSLRWKCHVDEISKGSGAAVRVCAYVCGPWICSATTRRPQTPGVRQEALARTRLRILSQAELLKGHLFPPFAAIKDVSAVLGGRVLKYMCDNKCVLPSPMSAHSSRLVFKSVAPSQCSVRSRNVVPRGSGNAKRRVDASLPMRYRKKMGGRGSSRGCGHAAVSRTCIAKRCAMTHGVQEAVPSVQVRVLRDLCTWYGQEVGAHESVSLFGLCSTHRCQSLM